MAAPAGAASSRRPGADNPRLRSPPSPGARPASAVSAARRSRLALWLFVATLMTTAATSFSMQAMDEIWLRHYNGDFAAHGRMMSRISSASSALSFMFKPLMGGLIDCFGRKKLLVLSPLLQMALKGATAVAPLRFAVPLITSQWLTGFFAWEGFMMAREAMMGDLFGHDPKALGQALSRLMMIWPLTSIFCPLVGGRLARVNVQLPFGLTALIFGLSSAMIALVIPETLPPAPAGAARSFNLATASPLSALKLFTKGSRLRAVAVLQLVSALGDGMVTWNISSIHRMQVTGWDSEARGRFESVSSVISLPGYVCMATSVPLYSRIS